MRMTLVTAAVLLTCVTLPNFAETVSCSLQMGRPITCYFNIASGDWREIGAFYIMALAVGWTFATAVTYHHLLRIARTASFVLAVCFGIGMQVAFSALWTPLMVGPFESFTAAWGHFLNAFQANLVWQWLAGYAAAATLAALVGLTAIGRDSAGIATRCAGRWWPKTA